METPLQPEIINSFKETFHEQITIDSFNPCVIYIKTDASLIRNLSEYVSIRHKGRFVTCAAIDHRKDMEKFTVVYIFSLDKAKTF
ncbi:MAG: hypothetical protein AMJ42_06075, partial [Deltaproteobacteria bacterium DG_8]